MSLCIFCCLFVFIFFIIQCIFPRISWYSLPLWFCQKSYLYVQGWQIPKISCSKDTKFNPKVSLPFLLGGIIFTGRTGRLHNFASSAHRPSSGSSESIIRYLSKLVLQGVWVWMSSSPVVWRLEWSFCFQYDSLSLSIFCRAFLVEETCDNIYPQSLLHGSLSSCWPEGGDGNRGWIHSFH